MFAKRAALMVSIGCLAVARLSWAVDGEQAAPVKPASPVPVAGAALAALSASAPTVANLARAQQAAVEANFKEQMARAVGAPAPAASAASAVVLPARVVRVARPRIEVDQSKLVLSIYGPQGAETAEIQLPDGAVVVCKRSCSGRGYRVTSVQRDGVVVSGAAGSLTVPVGSRFR